MTWLVARWQKRNLPQSWTEVLFTLRLFDLLIKPIASSSWLRLATMQKNVLEMHATILLKSRREGEGATKATSRTGYPQEGFLFDSKEREGLEKYGNGRVLRIEVICMQCRCTPTQTDQYKDQSKVILNSILKLR